MQHPAKKDIDRDEHGTVLVRKSLSQDSEVSWTANRLQLQMHLLRWKTGLVRFLVLKRPRTLQTISPRQLQFPPCPPLPLPHPRFFRRRTASFNAVESAVW